MGEIKERALRLPSFHAIPGAVAIDLDGTLLDGRSKLSSRNRAAVEGCISRGVPVVIATSRPLRTVRKLLGDELAGQCSLVLMNGALALGTPPLSGTFREGLPPEAATAIAERAVSMEPEVTLVVETDGRSFGTNMALDPESLWRVRSATPDMVMPLAEALACGPAKITAYHLGRDLSGLATELLRRFGDVAAIIPGEGETFLNIVGVGASKPDTLRRLLQPSGISLDTVLAFGDDTPDVGLLTACGLSVAVANAVPEVMTVVKYRTASNDDDGVGIVLELLLKALDGGAGKASNRNSTDRR